MKQFIYGVFYAGAIAGIAWLGFFASRGGASCSDGSRNGGETGIDCGGSCASCELQILRPIEVPRVTVFNLGAGRVSGLFEFKNLNVRFGADPFTYDIGFMGPGGVALGTTTRQSFIYPGEVKFTVQADIAAPPEFTNVRVETRNPSWQPAETFSRPEVVARGIETELRSGSREAVVSGYASNRSTSNLGTVTVNVEIAGSGGTAAGAGRTVIESLASQEDRFFKVIVPGVSLESISRDSVRISFEARRI
ncbi:MAG: hypothetical protein Q8L01_02890 [Candidatus Woesebacteria bacterium]|nr:hypothetical protein [Candidatus Woesebacteria bacterium]